MDSRFEPEPLNEAAQASLEHYLDQLCAPLQRDLSHQAYEDTRQELRAHLLLSVAAREELGSTAEEALNTACLNFGDPQWTGRNLAREKAATFRAQKRLAGALRLMGGLLGACIVPYLPSFSFLMNLEIDQGNVVCGSFLQVFLFLLGGSVGWSLLSGRRAKAGGPVAGLIGSQAGVGTALAGAMLANHYQWAGAVHSLEGLTLCFYTVLGTITGWLLWKRPKSMLGSICVGSLVFGVPQFVIGLEKMCHYPDYRTLHTLGIYTAATLISCACGGVTGATAGLFARSRSYFDKLDILSSVRTKEKPGAVCPR